MSRLRWAVLAQARSHCNRSASRRKRRPSRRDARTNNQELPRKPPVAKKKAYTRCIHGVSWDDPYHWMSNARDPCVREHLELENLYADSVMASTSALQSQLKEEMACRIVGDEFSPPERWGPWLYYARIPSGKDYPVYLRRQSTHSHQSWFQKFKSNVAKFLRERQNCFGEQKLLDMNELVKEHGFAHLGVCKVSKDHRLLAYTLDLFGTEVFTLFVKDIVSGALLSKPVVKGVVSVEWARDSRSLLYTRIDKMLRPFRVFKHTINSKGDDILLYEDKDPQNFVDVSKTKDWQFFTINSNSKTSSEVYLLEAEGSVGNLKLVERRRPGVEYFVEHQHGNLFLLTNAELHNEQGAGSSYRLFLCPVDDLRRENWKQIVSEEHSCIIYDMDIFENYLVLFQRKEGLPQLSALKLPIRLDMVEKVCPHILPLPKGVCSIAPGLNQDYSSSILRLCVSSPVMPDALLDYNLSSKEYAILQQDKVVVKNAVKSSCRQEHGVHELLESKDFKSNASQQVFDLSDIYACEHLRVPSFDMVDVPLTVVYSRKLKVKGKNPAFMTGYGAYGESLDMKWCSDYLSLLDRGWVLAFAHVRGGGELGKAWHDSGRLSQKLNSMRDFLACGEYLVKTGFAHKDWLTAKGVSAGGLLVAASTNMQPDLFRAVILKVPFLDIGNTMLEESLALTISEYEEWGSPEKKETFDYIRSYTPYDNVKDTQYPHMLVLSSFLDTRVGYWEAAKWVARLREYNKANVERLVLLKTNMNSGHFTESGRYLHIEGTALEYAFLLKAIDNSILKSNK